MDLPILKYVDILIGFSLVMLLVATVALSIAQALLNMTTSRARHLAGGLEQLIRQIHPQLLGPHAPEIARQVLLHPLIRQPRSAASRWIRAVFNWLISFLPIKRRALPITEGAVILREELAICLLEWASEDGAWTMAVTPDADPEQSRLRREAIAAALKQRGIEDPSSTLKAFRLQAMKNEQEHPEQSSQLWRSQALVQTATSDFLARLFQSFDTAMARTTASFGAEAQVWVSMVALVLVFAVQLDSFALIHRLSVDDRYRETLVKEADRLNREAAELGAKPPNDAALKILSGTDCDELGKDAKPAKTAEAIALDKQRCEINASLAVLQSPVYDLRSSWGRGWWPSPKYFEELPGKLPGILAAWVLVSLGAPFWFDMIKNLFKLRSLVAQKDEADRTQREAAPASKPAAATTTPDTATAGNSNPD